MDNTIDNVNQKICGDKPGVTTTPTRARVENRPLVLVDTNSRILKSALERRSNIKVTMGCNNNYTSPAPPTQIPYGTDDLRRKVLKQYFARIVVPRYLDIRDEDTVREAFADFVINVPILIDGHRVSRKSWAKAFYESDIINSAKCMFEALFSEEEMRKCTLNGKNQTEELSAVKMLAILRASCWMKTKEQDPYLFNPAIQSHNVHPSREEQDKIEKKVFTERRSQANRKNRKRQLPYAGLTTLLEVDSDSQNMDFDRNSNTSDEYPSLSSPSDSYSSSSRSSSSLSLSPDPSGHHFPKEMPVYDYGELETLFYHFPDAFLDTLLPDWRESYIFIDGLLVDLDKWKKAWEEVSDPVKAAWTLFLALFSDAEIRKCTLNGKNGTTELCPVKKLAIIRAVEWMRRNQDEAQINPGITTYWDNDDEDCNVFPSKEDKEKIETKVFTEKRYQQSRHLNLSKSSSSSSSSSASTASLSPPYNSPIQIQLRHMKL